MAENFKLTHYPEGGGSDGRSIRKEAGQEGVHEGSRFPAKFLQGRAAGRALGLVRVCEL